MGNLFTYPLKQHVGVPAAAVVRRGDRILRGQRIAEAPQGALSASIYSSVSGVVENVDDNGIRIAADAEQSKDYLKLGDGSPDGSPLELIARAGIVGLGGAGFPTWAKLNKPFEKNGVVVVNAVECEPILRHNIERIESDPAGFVRGLQIAMEVTRASKGFFAVKSIHGDAIARLKAAVEDARISAQISVKELPNMYPMGEERAVLRETLDILLGVDQLPLAAEAVVINAETAYRIKEAVDDKKPLIDKDLTVAGKLKGELIQTFMNVPLGISVKDVFEMAGGLGSEYGELIMGGPFTGKRTMPDEPVVKTTGGLIAAETFLKGPEKIGLLVCACGGNKERLEEIAVSMGSGVVGIEYCKQAMEVKPGVRKCENPGKCPGQVQKVMALKKAGAASLLISNCTDCTNTVMSCAPQLKLPVYHCTDGALRAVNRKLIRRFKG